MAKRLTLKNDSILAWGVLSVFFGIMLMVRKLNFLPLSVSTVLFDWKNYLIYGGIIFLLCQKNKLIGSLMLGIGILLNLQAYFKWQQAYAPLLWPLLFTIVGITLILIYLRK